MLHIHWPRHPWNLHGNQCLAHKVLSQLSPYNKVEGALHNTPPKSNTCACLLTPYPEDTLTTLNVIGAKHGWMWMKSGVVSVKCGVNLWWKSDWIWTSNKSVARGGLCICIYYDPTCKSYRGLIYSIGWKVRFSVVVVWSKSWGHFGRKWGWFWVKMGSDSQQMSRWFWEPFAMKKNMGLRMKI